MPAAIPAWRHSIIFQKIVPATGAAILLLLGPATAQAQACNNKLLSGDYSYQVVGQDGTETPFRPFVSERLVTFDGKGYLSGKGYRVLAGSGAASSVTGTYSVQPGCSIRLSITALGADGSVSDKDESFGVVTESGRRVHGVVFGSLVPGTNRFEFDRTAN